VCGVIKILFRAIYKYVSTYPSLWMGCGVESCCVGRVFITLYDLTDEGCCITHNFGLTGYKPFFIY